MNNFYGKNVLITGASRGLGAATAREFAKHGFNIIINYVNNDESANKLKEELENTYHVEAILAKADISNEQECLNMITKIEQELGPIDVLINNAGIAIDTTLEDKTVENFKRILDVNLVGTFILCKHIGMKMFERKNGSIINISSTNGIDTYYNYSMDYDASKAGIINLTHNLANEFAPYVRVNSIAPGWINTDMNKELDEEQIKEECASITLGRFAECSEIAKEIYHVAVESTYINSAIIRVDGGLKC